MKFKIHRGTQEIGGSCVEVWTENTRILIDLGMPLVEWDGSEFDFRKYQNMTVPELVKHGVLPDVPGLYINSEDQLDGVLISHAHKDHFGLTNYMKPRLNCHLGRATHKIIELNNLFSKQDIHLKNPIFFEKEVPFNIGDFEITAYWADHSAFDAYSFLIKTDVKSIFYSGDFRSHGRKVNAFKWFTHNAPQNVDYLLLEGTTIGRTEKVFKSEQELEEDFVGLFSEKGKINMVYTSGQNIDRLTTIYRACLRTKRTLVVDVYIAKVLSELSEFAAIPFPSKNYSNLRVMFPYYLSRRLNNSGNEKILYQFKQFKITKEEISSQASNIVMLVRPSLLKDLDYITGIDGGNFIYSLWEGYKNKKDTKDFIDYFLKRGFQEHYIHTSGHADIQTLKEMADSINPNFIVPIHTFNGDEYSKIFTQTIVKLKDGEIKEVF